MKLAVIAPTSMLLRYCRTDYHLVLAHLRDDNKYVEFYKHTARGYKMLDNGAAELGQSVDVDVLFQSVYTFEPNEVILPDKLGDWKFTFESAQRTARDFKTVFPELKLMAVPQDLTTALCWYKDCMKYMQIPDVDTIGIPKGLKRKRLDVLELLNRDRPSKWEYHLLGTTGNPVEVKVAAERYPWLRGVDSKIPVRLGQYGITLHPERGLLLPQDHRAHLPEMKFDSTDDPFPIIISHNIKTMQSWAEGGAHGTESTGGRVLQLPTKR